MTSSGLLVLAAVLCTVSVVGTWAFVCYATRAELFDVPNERSSHTALVPRGGGLVFSMLTLIGLAIWSVMAPIGDALPGIAFLTSTAILSLGVLDDRLSLPATGRLAFQIAACVTLVASIGPLPPLSLAGDLSLPGGPVLATLAVIGLVWLINLYNFMDGIDALAASEGLFVAVCGALLCWLLGDTGTAAWLTVLGACLAGFLLWNLPPARVFMGDAGSVFLGFFFGMAALLAHERGGPELWVWLILLGTFCVDATFTLLRRVRLGQRPLEAHRTHAYQYLSRRYASHGRVSAAIAAVNVGWLAPWALAATVLPRYGLLFLLVAYAPLVVIAWRAGAGTPERPAT